MPHIVLEYTQNLIASVDVPKLLADLHHALAAQPDIDLKRIKTRALVIANSVVKDRDHNDGQFMHVTVSVLEGRSATLRKQYGQALYDILMAARPEKFPDCALTLEVREMNRETYFM